MLQCESEKHDEHFDLNLDVFPVFIFLLFVQSFSAKTKCEFEFPDYNFFSWFDHVKVKSKCSCFFDPHSDTCAIFYFLIHSFTGKVYTCTHDQHFSCHKYSGTSTLRHLQQNFVLEN